MFALTGIASYIRIGLLIAFVVAVYLAYQWGSDIITTYNENIVKVARLEREATLRESRLASKQTVIERQRAAIDASKCKAQIDKWIKDPDLLKKPDAFGGNGGG